MNVANKDINLLLGVELLEPQVVFPQFVFNDSHTQRADLEVSDDAVELREARKTEENVHDVRRQLRALFPVFAQNARQSADCRLCTKNKHRAAHNLIRSQNSFIPYKGGPPPKKSAHCFTPYNFIKY